MESVRPSSCVHPRRRIKRFIPNGQKRAKPWMKRPSSMKWKKKKKKHCCLFYFAMLHIIHVVVDHRWCGQSSADGRPLETQLWMIRAPSPYVVLLFKRKIEKLLLLFGFSRVHASFFSSSYIRINVFHFSIDDRGKVRRSSSEFTPHDPMAHFNYYYQPANVCVVCV